MKKIIPWILVLAMLMIPCVSAGAEEETPEFTGSEGLVTGYNGPGGEVEVPGEIDGETVRIYQIYRSSDETITGIILPDSVEAIGSMTISFMNALEHMELPDGLKVIGSNNFSGCDSLEEVTIPASVLLIGDNCFTSTDGLRSVTFLGDVPAIMDECFTYLSDEFTVYAPDDRLEAYQEALPGINVQPSGKNAVIIDQTVPEEDVRFDAETGTILGYTGDAILPVLPSSVGGVPVRAIGSKIFSSCPAQKILFGVIIPDGVESIGDEAIDGWNSFLWVGLPDSVKTIGNKAFAGYYRAGGFDAPASLESIGDEAFYGSLVRNVSFPGTMKHIGSRVFASSALDYISLDLYEMIDVAPDAFAGSYLSDIDLPWDSSWENRLAWQELVDSQVEGCTVWINNPPDCEYVKGDYEFAVTDSGFERLVSYNGTQEAPYLYYNIRETVDGERVYIDVDGLGDGVFKGNQTIRRYRVTHANRAFHIGAEAFADSSVELIDLFYTTESIGEGAFRNCAGVEELTLPASLKEVGEGAFEGMTGLKKLVVKCDPSVIPEGSFDTCTALETVTSGEGASFSEDLALAKALGISRSLPGETVERFGGEWYLVELGMGDVTYNPADLGMSVTLTLQEDGTAELLSQEGPEEGTWFEQDGNVNLWTESSGELTMVPREDELVIDRDGQMMRFSREAPAGTKLPGAVEADDISAFDGVWNAVTIEAYGMVMPVNEETTGEMAQMLGMKDTEISILDGSAVIFGGETEAFEFADGRLQILRETPEGAQEGALNEIIELREEDMLTYTVMGMTFYCERIGDAAPKEPESAPEPLPEPEPEPTGMPESEAEPVPGPAGGSDSLLPEPDRTYHCVSIGTGGGAADPARLGGEFSVTFRSDSTVSLVIAGEELEGLHWYAKEDKAVIVSYDGELMEFSKEDDGYVLAYRYGMNLRFAP